MPVITGHLNKMRTTLADPVEYTLPLDDELLPMNPLIGSHVKLSYSGVIHCTHCGRKSNKSFSQGYCYPCFKKLAQCDMCIVKPEQCHYAEGTCREPEWGDANCMIDHFVYLANSSGVKIGITRHSQIPTRWMDQGASQALPIFRVKTRQISGLIEDGCKAFENDKTDWRRMLKGNPEPIDLIARREALFEKTAGLVEQIREQFGEDAVERVRAESATDIRYPVENHPEKIKTFNLDKDPVAEGVLTGIKGQYLIFENTVINVRKFTAYYVSVEY